MNYRQYFSRINRGVPCAGKWKQTKKILGSESFARWLVSLALVLALEIELVLALEIKLELELSLALVLVLALEIELVLALEIELELVLEIELVLALEIEHYRITTSVSHLTCHLPQHQSVI